MTAGQGTRRLSNVSLAPAPLAALLAATLLGGTMIGAAITLQIASTDRGTTAIGAAGQPAAPFDAVRFRAEEHAAVTPQAAFDNVRFRAEEHAALLTGPDSGAAGTERTVHPGAP